MKEVKRKVEKIRSRIRFNCSLKTVSWLWIIVLSVACCMVMLDRIYSLGWPLQRWLLMGLAASLATGLLFGLLRRFSTLNAAAYTDQKLNLRERISSCLWLDKDSGKMIRALQYDASQMSQHFTPAQVEPFRVTRLFCVSPVLLVVFILLLNFFNYSGEMGKQTANQQNKVTAVEKKAQAKKIEKIKEKIEKQGIRAQKLDILKQAITDMDMLSKKLRDNKISKKEAMAKVSSLADKVKTERDKMAEQMRAMGDLKPYKDYKMLQPLAKALKEQDFKGAAMEIENLKVALDAKELNADQMIALKMELKALSKAMQANPELAKMLKKLSEKMGEGQEGEEGEKGEGEGSLGEMMDLTMDEMAALADMMESMELLEQVYWDLEKEKAMMSGAGAGGMGDPCPYCDGTGICPDCDGNGVDESGAVCELCEGGGQCPYCDGTGVSMGSGMGAAAGSGSGDGGGEGAGYGYRAEQADNTATTRVKIKGRPTKGKIIAQFMVKGEQVKGESNIELRETFKQYQQEGEEALSKENIPISYKNYVRDYMDAIQPQQKSTAKEATTTRE
jgi:cell division protein FtsB